MAGPVVVAEPTITAPDGFQVGKTLYCYTGTWSPTPSTYTYQWQNSSDLSSWSDIGGATSSTYVLTTASDNKYVRCNVTAGYTPTGGYLLLEGGGHILLESGGGSLILETTPQYTTAASNWLGPLLDIGHIVQVAWSSNPGDASPVWTDISKYVLGVNTNRSKQRILQRFDAGTMSLRLDNTTRNFEPGYAGSAFYPNVVPIKQIRFGFVINGVISWQYTGFVERWPQLFPEGPYWSEVDIECIDALSLLSNHYVASSYPSVTTSTGVSNADLKYTSTNYGTISNGIQISYVSDVTPPSVSTVVNPNSTYLAYINVNLGNNVGSGSSGVTATQISAAINNDPVASSYISAAVVGSGAGVLYPNLTPYDGPYAFFANSGNPDSSATTATGVTNGDITFTSIRSLPGNNQFIKVTYTSTSAPPSISSTGTLGGTQTVTDGAITSGSNVLSCGTSAPFTSFSVGQNVSGTGIPAGTTITGYTSSSQVTMSANATATATGVTVTFDNLVFSIYVGSGATGSTANQILQMVNADASASQYIVASLAPGNDGSGVLVGSGVPYGGAYVLSGGTFTSQTTGSYIGQILDFCGWNGSRSISTGVDSVQGQVFAKDGGTVALDQIQLAEQTEDGQFFVARDGTMTFLDRTALNSGSRINSQITLSDSPNYVNVFPYQDLQIDYDTDLIYNDVRGARMNSSVIVETIDSTSAAQYFTRQLSIDGILSTSDAMTLNLAKGLLWRFKNPSLRLEPMTLTPGNNIAFWQALSSLDYMQRVTIYRTPPAGGSPIKIVGQVIGIQIDNQGGPITNTTWTLSVDPMGGFGDGQYFLILDDSTYGKLDSTNILGY